MSIYVGTCGFAYPEWDGFFYPPNLRVSDRLTYYAERFRAVELDSLFYHLPEPESMEKLARRTRRDFRFAVKLHHSITHENGLTAPEYGGVQRALAPLQKAGKLGPVLAQFPPSFACTRANVQAVRAIREEFADLPLVVEFRHASWTRPETLAFLSKHRIALCATGEPDAMPPASLARTSDLLYVRLHGRAVSGPRRTEGDGERGGDLYPEATLEAWAARIEEAARDAREAYVLFGNVYQAGAAANARDLARRLGVASPLEMRRGVQETLALV